MNITIIFTFTTYNIFCTISDLSMNNIYLTLSSGKIGFKNKQKTTIYACQLLLTKILIYCNKYTFKIINLHFKGDSYLKLFIIKTLITSNIYLNTITDTIIYSYNGCKYKKQLQHENYF